MNDYRLLTDDEVLALEDNGCTAEDWTNVSVAEDFLPTHIRNVRFYGEVNLGVFEQSVEVSRDFMKHSGIKNATLRNTTVGNNCLIENVGNFINNYVIGDECIISNVATIETTDGATFGEGTVISVLNEAGGGNVILFSGLTSNLAALMVCHSHDKEFTATVRRLVREDTASRVPEVGTIGNHVKITNTTEITNTHIANDCEVNGACRLSDCTLTATPNSSVYIGSGVICENSIIALGSAVLNSAKISNCYVGECSQLTNGFMAENSLFFANCYMSNGEACAAFCGPFSASHHKSSLLIGGMFSFYNAGSATNFSNHAYKMGPVHYGILERGSKTASGSHILFPAKIGAFSVCLGKIANHPDTKAMPFSYLIADGKEVHLVPAINLATVGVFRDVRKWPHRDRRPMQERPSHVNYSWLNPRTINEVRKGLCELRKLQEQGSDEATSYTYNGCLISRKALLRGIDYYSMAIKLFLYHELKDINVVNSLELIADVDSDISNGEWEDLSGLLLPASEEEHIVSEITNGKTRNIYEITELLNDCDSCYRKWLLSYAIATACQYYGCDTFTIDTLHRIKEQGTTALNKWLNAIKRDAEREYSMGDVDQEVLDSFLKQLPRQIEES